MRDCVSWNKHCKRKEILQVHQDRNYVEGQQRFLGSFLEFFFHHNPV